MTDGRIPFADSISLRIARPFLGRRVALVIDRPLGSRHPRCGFRYTVNYGFVPGTSAPDGCELDAYLLGVGEAVARGEGVCVAIVHRFFDDDDKLIVVSEGVEAPDDAAILAAVASRRRQGST
ncbi:hypothetical protein [Nocardia sp. NPDC050710]|uniref:hypothetical protein n=1 Tax=Nocardia sp. NPDC050710 TaxID=3157220 RepID=UPI0033DEAAD8